MPVTQLLPMIFLALFINHCTTPSDKSSAPTAPLPQTAVTTPAAETKEDGDKLFRYYKRLTDRRMPYTQADAEYLAKRSDKPQPGSLEEAVATAGVLRATLAKADSTQSFEEQDLYQHQPTPQSPALGGAGVSAPAVSLEKNLTEKDLDLEAALENNPYLKSYEIYQLVDEALKKTTNSPGFQDSISALLKSEAGRWSALTPPGAPATPEPPPAEASVPVVTPVETNIPGTPGALPPSAAEIKTSDIALLEAQKLAEQGLYKLAIKKANTVANSDPMYPTAREKIKLFSNRAVQTLRQKAAEAFQNAIPVADPATKASYLEQARGYLQEALNNFPEADSLPTVQENLAVISRDLDRLNANRAAPPAAPQPQ